MTKNGLAYILLEKCIVVLYTILNLKDSFVGNLNYFVALSFYK